MKYLYIIFIAEKITNGYNINTIKQKEKKNKETKQGVSLRNRSEIEYKSPASLKEAYSLNMA